MDLDFLHPCGEVNGLFLLVDLLRFDKDCFNGSWLYELTIIQDLLRNTTLGFFRVFLIAQIHAYLVEGQIGIL
jgi:hypothetical protein